MEPPLKRQRADSADTVPSHLPTTTSNADPPPTVESSATAPGARFPPDMFKRIEALDSASADNNDFKPFSHRLLHKLAAEDPAVAARINEAYDAYLEKEKNIVVDFQKDIKRLGYAIPSTRDGATTPAEIPSVSSKIESTFFTSVSRICGRTYEFSSFGTKKNSLDALRKLLVLIVQIPDKKLRAAVVDHINTEDGGRVAPSMADIVHSLTYEERELVCRMAVDGAKVTVDETGCWRGTFHTKFLELKERDLLDAGFEINFAPFVRPLEIWPEDIEEDGSDFDPELAMEADYEDGI